MTPQQISALIDNSPMNRGMVGSTWLATPGNIAITIDDDAMIFEHRAPGVYEFHWLRMVTKGREAIERTRLAFDEIFARPETGIVFGLVSAARRDVKFMARWIGAKFVVDVDTDCGPCEMYVVTREMREGAGA